MEKSLAVSCTVEHISSLWFSISTAKININVCTQKYLKRNFCMRCILYSKKNRNNLYIHHLLKVKVLCSFYNWAFAVFVSCVWLFVNPRIPRCHVSLSFTISLFAQTHVLWGDDAIQLAHPLSSPSPPALNLSQPQGLFPMSHLFASGDQNIGASESVLPINVQGWFSLNWLVGSPCCPRGSQVFPSTTIQKHQFFGAQPSLWSNSHICT